jgi:hypothetical protein
MRTETFQEKQVVEDHERQEEHTYFLPADLQRSLNDKNLSPYREVFVYRKAPLNQALVASR